MILSFRPRRRRGTVAVLGTLAVAALSLLPVAASAATATTSSPATSSPATSSPATTDTSPVNLSTKINMADGKAHRNATVIAGDARFEVIAPDVIRLEYAP